MSDTTTGYHKARSHYSERLLLWQRRKSKGVGDLCESENERELACKGESERERKNETIPYHLERSIISILVLKSQVLE